MDNNTLTAVDWLEEALAENLKQIIVNSDSALMESLFAKAKAMQKEQMKDAVLSQCTTNEGLRKIFENQFEQYYSETYEK